MESTSFGCLPSIDQLNPLILLCQQKIWRSLVRPALSYFSRLQNRVPSLASDQCLYCIRSLCFHYIGFILNNLCPCFHTVLTFNRKKWRDRRNPRSGLVARSN